MTTALLDAGLRPDIGHVLWPTWMSGNGFRFYDPDGNGGSRAADPFRDHGDTPPGDCVHCGHRPRRRSH
jgi:hypothetical protein